MRARSIALLASTARRRVLLPSRGGGLLRPTAQAATWSSTSSEGRSAPSSCVPSQATAGYNWSTATRFFSSDKLKDAETVAASSTSPKSAEEKRIAALENENKSAAESLVDVEGLKMAEKERWVGFLRFFEFLALVTLPLCVAQCFACFVLLFYFKSLCIALYCVYIFFFFIFFPSSSSTSSLYIAFYLFLLLSLSSISIFCLFYLSSIFSSSFYSHSNYQSYPLAISTSISLYVILSISSSILSSSILSSISIFHLSSISSVYTYIFSPSSYSHERIHFTFILSPSFIFSLFYLSSIFSPSPYSHERIPTI
jgi:hypothetical protein